MPSKKHLVLTAFAIVLLLAGTASAQRIHLDLEGDNDFIQSLKSAESPFGIPPNCSTWHELSPVHCNLHHQSEYFDTDGDGALSPCDGIQLNGDWYHIEWVGWTVFCSDGSWTLEPADIDPIDPTITSWFEVAPHYGKIHKLESWTRADGEAVDFGLSARADGHSSMPEPKAGDSLDFTDIAEPCEIVRVSVDIIVTPR